MLRIGALAEAGNGIAPGGLAEALSRHVGECIAMCGIDAECVAVSAGHAVSCAEPCVADSD